MSIYFYCYSMKLFHFLRENKIYFVCKGISDTSGKTYWVFERDEKFLDTLTEYGKVRDYFK